MDKAKPSAVPRTSRHRALGPSRGTSRSSSARGASRARGHARGRGRGEAPSAEGRMRTTRRDTDGASTSRAELDHSATPPSEVFKHRWRNADVRQADEGVCTDIEQDFRLIGCLGSGLYGRTFEVLHRRTRTTVALKLCSFRRMSRAIGMMKGGASSDDEQDEPVFHRTAVERRVATFRLEKLVVTCLTGLSPFFIELVKLAGAHLATVSVCDVKKGEMGFATEIMFGDLYDVWIKWGKSVDPKSGPAKEDYRRMMVFVAAQLAEAVRFLHHCGVVHHDLHPGNILMGRDGYVKLTDFGLSFVDAAPGDSPASVEQCNRKNRNFWKLFGPPEDMFRTLVMTQGRSENDRPQLPDIDRTVDLHMLGYCLLRLDWPVDFSSALYCDIQCNEEAQTFDEFARTYTVTRVPKTIDSVCAGFIRLLTISQPQMRLGADCVDDILMHTIFRSIDFDLLRKKQLPAPVCPALHIILERGEDESSHKEQSISSPWCISSAEAQYSETLGENDKRFVFKTFENFYY